MEAVPVALPLVEEFHWQGGAQVGANLVLFAVHTEDGVVGWGESICEVPLATAEFGKAIARQVVGGRVDEVETILDKIWSRGRWKTTPQFTQFVVSGIESACWDALGRTLGRPTHALFGGAVQNELDFFGFPQGDDAASLAAGARRLSDHEVIYLKIGRPRDDDAVVAAVREAIGPEKVPARRPERGVGRGHGHRANPPSGRPRARLGRAARAALGRGRARPRA